MAIRLLTLNRACDLDQIAEQQQLFSNGGFPGVGVRNDRQYAPAFDFLLKLCRKHRVGFFMGQKSGDYNSWHAISQPTPNNKLHRMETYSLF